MLLLALCLLPLAFAGEVCYPDLGCFSDEYPWHDLPDRPISHLPQSREEVGTEFFLNTRQNPEPNSGSQTIINTDLDSISNSYFDPSRDTKFIIHGYVQNANVDWMRDMAIEFVNHEDCNVFRVNWIKGGLEIQYGIATANIRIVGAEIAFLVEQIRSIYGSYSASKIHVIGHSLGAHAAGHAGERLPGLARITGMDPAGPYFENTDPIVRLDPTDAVFVDAIHSDSDKVANLGMGIHMPVAHVDFYPNEGRVQPGCDQGLVEKIIIGGGIYDGAVQFIACNHLRAVTMFSESIKSNCPFTAEECSGNMEYDRFLSGQQQCWGVGQSQLGLKAIDYFDPSRQNVIYFSKTYDQPPFCGYQFQVQIFIDDPRKAEQFRAFVHMEFEGTNGKSERVIINENGASLELKPGNDYHFVAAPRIDPGTLSSVYLFWELDYEWYNPGDWPIFDDAEIFVSTMTVKSMEGQTSYNFCGSTTPIDEGRDVRQFSTC